MVDIADQVRQVFDPVPAVGLEEVVAASERRRRRHRRLAGVAGGLSAGVVAVIVAALALGGTSPTRVTTGPVPGAGQGAHPTSPPAGGSTGLSATLNLSSTTVRSGGTLSGQIVVENNTGSALHLEGPCNYIFAAVLAHGSYQPPAVWLQCLSTVTVPVGRSSYPVLLIAQYRGCLPADTPPCIDGQPLPPGTYQAKVYEYSNSIPVPAPVTVTVTAPGPNTGDGAPTTAPTPSTTVLRNTKITYWGAIPSSYNDSNGLHLTPPPQGAAPAIPWQQAAKPCVQTTGTNNCAALTSPEEVYLAVGSDKYFSDIGPENTLMYVIDETELCPATGNGPPSRPEPTSTTAPPTRVACTYLAFVNATTGKGMGAMSGPGLKPIPSQ